MTGIVITHLVTGYIGCYTPIRFGDAPQIGMCFSHHLYLSFLSRASPVDIGGSFKTCPIHITFPRECPPSTPLSTLLISPAPGAQLLCFPATNAKFSIFWCVGCQIFPPNRLNFDSFTLQSGQIASLVAVSLASV